VIAGVPIARVFRSGLEESVHLGHVAICDVEGRLLAAAGDPGRRVFARSSMKPLQAAVSLRAIGEDLPDELVAVMCASLLHHPCTGSCRSDPVSPVSVQGRPKARARRWPV